MSKSELYEKSVAKSVKVFQLRRELNWSDEDFELAVRYVVTHLKSKKNKQCVRATFMLIFLKVPVRSITSYMYENWWAQFIQKGFFFSVLSSLKLRFEAFFYVAVWVMFYSSLSSCAFNIEYLIKVLFIMQLLLWFYEIVPWVTFSIAVKCQKSVSFSKAAQWLFQSS